jgi:xylulokinase
LILTLDLGTSTTKAVVWDSEGPEVMGRAGLLTTFPAGDRAEQDPSQWWPAVRAACAQARAASPSSFDAVEAIGFAAARQTFVPVTDTGEALGPALVWSDGRASGEALVMAGELGGMDAVRARTGAFLDGSSMAAKVAWWAGNEPDRWARSRWLLTPRDFAAWKMTGEVATDASMVSAAGLTDAAGRLVPELTAGWGQRLPPVLRSDAVVGLLSAGAAGELGLKAGIPVVIGAGDRACEVLGTAATTDRPMVAWGTTANVSVPVRNFPDPVPPGLMVTRGATGGWLLEGGLSAAGSALTWLSSLTGRDTEALMAAARAAPAGARGVIALPWFSGARAPWWKAGARAGFVGLSFNHDHGDLARALIEAVASEVRRCLTAAGARSPGDGGAATGLALTGADETTAPWAEVLTAVTGLPAVRRRSGQSASAGAALLTSEAVGAGFVLDQLDPVIETVPPDAGLTAKYAEQRARIDAAADAVMSLDAWEQNQ